MQINWKERYNRLLGDYNQLVIEYDTNSQIMARKLQVYDEKVKNINLNFNRILQIHSTRYQSIIKDLTDRLEMKSTIYSQCMKCKQIDATNITRFGSHNDPYASHSHQILKQNRPRVVKIEKPKSTNEGKQFNDQPSPHFQNQPYNFPITQQTSMNASEELSKIANLKSILKDINELPMLHGTKSIIEFDEFKKMIQDLKLKFTDLELAEIQQALK
ncbi:hypothetical protein BC833DRAFT_591272 [Globomyces pollinis-pini]|nr:hypothetical protein BC833DRAFT_591272 [Globomyces pollinis-pini]